MAGSQDGGLLPKNYPGRFQLAEEVHARPPEVLATPTLATHLVLIVPPADRESERAHLTRLCETFSVKPPAANVIHFAADLDRFHLKWERHGEFSSYTFFMSGAGPLSPPEDLLPKGWVGAIPGETIFAARASLLAAGDADPGIAMLADAFGSNSVVGARVGDGAGLAFTDFKVHADGFSRFLLFNRSLTPRQSGRMMQRLFEIETYRMMALLALPLARAQSARIGVIENMLLGLTEDIARRSIADESLLQQLTNLAAEVESMLVASQFRFGACKAYHDLVTTRISELREGRLDGFQTIQEFMARRFTPAVATCASTAQRLRDLSERVGQTTTLLSTRVDIARERQNQMLLGAMNTRAKLQFRLQQVVEILSVIPITYYLVGLSAYVFKAMKDRGVAINTDLAGGIAIPIIAALVILAVRQAHHKVMGDPQIADE